MLCSYYQTLIRIKKLNYLCLFMILHPQISFTFDGIPIVCETNWLVDTLLGSLHRTHSKSLLFRNQYPDIRITVPTLRSDDLDFLKTFMHGIFKLIVDTA